MTLRAWRALVFAVAAVFLAGCGCGAVPTGLEATFVAAADAPTTFEFKSVGTVTVPAQAYPSDTTLRLSTTFDTVIDGVFQNNAAIFAPGSRAGFELRVEAPGVPAKPLEATLKIPPELGPADQALVFVSTAEGNEEDQINRFTPRRAVKKDAATLSVTLDPADFFVWPQTPAGHREAIVILAAAGGAGGVPPSVSQPLLGTGTRRDALEKCPDNVLPLRPPLDMVQIIRSASDVTTKITNSNGEVVEKKGHPGTDFVAPDSTPLKSPGRGTVIRAVNSNGQELNDDNGGAGGTVVIDIPGSGRVQYMHLKKDELRVKAGDSVMPGDVIGLSDSSGYSTKSHLHFEFRPEGSAARIAPELCFEKTKVTQYRVSFTHREARFDAQATRLADVSARGTFVATFEAEVPPFGGMPLTWTYGLSEPTLTITDVFRKPVAGTTCGTFQTTPRDFSAIGQLWAFPSAGTYALGVSLSATAVENCVTGTTMHESTLSAFTSSSFSFAYDCTTTGGGSPDFPTDFRRFPFVSGMTLEHASQTTCTKSDGSSLQVESSWRIEKVR